MAFRRTSRSCPPLSASRARLPVALLSSSSPLRERRKTLALDLAGERPEATVLDLVQSAVSWPRLAGRRDQGVHVIQIFFEGAASARRETEIGPGRAPDERFFAGDVPGFLELPRVDAEVAVTDVERGLQVRERHGFDGRQGAEDAQAH